MPDGDTIPDHTGIPSDDHAEPDDAGIDHQVPVDDLPPDPLADR